MQAQSFKEKKKWWDWTQIIVTTILVPLILGAWRWAGTVEDRFSADRMDIRMNQKDIASSMKADESLMRLVDKLIGQTTEVLQRLSSIEAKLPK